MIVGRVVAFFSIALRMIGVVLNLILFLCFAETLISPQSHLWGYNPIVGSSLGWESFRKASCYPFARRVFNG